MRDPLRTLLAMAIAASSSGPVRAVDLLPDDGGEASLSLDSALKSTTLISRAPDDPVLFPERWSGTQLLRARFALSGTYSDWLAAEAAYEQRARVVSEGAGLAGGGGGLLPPETDAPFRLVTLDGDIAREGDTFRWSHELDRLLGTIHGESWDVTVGRQAIGLGRGVLFGAVDVFAPFSPLELDREWRRGVDAVRGEYRVTDTTSVGLLGAFGESWRDSALLAQARGYVGDVDGEVLVGKRAEDLMAGVASSAAVWDAEIHLEVAVFHSRDPLPVEGLFGDDRLAAKAVVGSSYTFDVGDGLTCLGEYHYSGYGVEDMKEARDRLSDPSYQKRYLRGDTQILGRHAIALQSRYPLSDTVEGSLLLLVSPVDGSGLAVPYLAWDFATNVTIVGSVYLPWGEAPVGGDLRSEYGASPTSLFLQLRLYF